VGRRRAVAHPRSFTLSDNDLKAHNGFDVPQNVAAKPFDRPTTSNHRTRLELPARSYTTINSFI
jgi:alpha-L-arabinofuranosidase